MERANGRVILKSRKREVDFPVSAATTLEHLVRGEPAMAGAIDDGLDWESRKVVLAALIREGLIVNDSTCSEIC